MCKGPCVNEENKNEYICHERVCFTSVTNFTSIYFTETGPSPFINLHLINNHKEQNECPMSVSYTHLDVYKRQV